MIKYWYSESRGITYTLRRWFPKLEPTNQTLPDDILKNYAYYKAGGAAGGHVFNYEDLRHRKPDYIDWLNQADYIYDYSPENFPFYSARKKHIKLPVIDYKIPNIPKKEKIIGALFYGYVSDRRREIAKQLEKQGVKHHFIDGTVSEQTLNFYIASSKIILSIHTYDEHRNDQLRVIPALSKGAKVVMESGEQWFNEYASKHGAIVCNYNEIAETCKNILLSEQEAC